MPQAPVVATIFRHEWDALQRLAGKGEAWAAEQIAQIWDAFKGACPCFLCERPIEDHWPPKTQIVPKLEDKSRLFGVPLCRDCAQLRSNIRLQSALDKLRSRQRKEVNFGMTLPRQYH